MWNGTNKIFKKCYFLQVDEFTDITRISIFALYYSKEMTAEKNMPISKPLLSEIKGEETFKTVDLYFDKHLIS